MKKTCSFCNGSGRDPVTPEKRLCMMCGGTGATIEMGNSAGSGFGTKGNIRDGNDGCGIVVLLFLFITCSYFIGAGYVLSTELVSHFWIGGRYTDHSWYQVAIYSGFSVAAVVFIARYWGLLPGVLVGIIPAMPLYYATKGGVGFWFIVHNGGEDIMNNVFSSWVALIGMISIHTLIAYSVLRSSDSFSERMLRWQWIRSPTGISATIVFLGASSAVIYIISEAIRHF